LQFNFIAVSCGVTGVTTDDRQALVHKVTSNGWREDGVMWHVTSECASNTYRALSNMNQTGDYRLHHRCHPHCCYQLSSSSLLLSTFMFIIAPVNVIAGLFEKTNLLSLELSLTEYMCN
jgi:hypothetical protein